VSQLDTLIAAGIVPQHNTLTEADRGVIETLSDSEVQALVNLKQKLGDDFLRRNSQPLPNCFL
jgi:hypothetical protein